LREIKPHITVINISSDKLFTTDSTSNMNNVLVATLVILIGVPVMAQRRPTVINTKTAESSRLSVFVNHTESKGIIGNGSSIGGKGQYQPYCLCTIWDVGGVPSCTCGGQIYQALINSSHSILIQLVSSYGYG
jgi:hypothetical protein